MPKYSIVMPAYNAGDYIKEAIESVIRQSLPDWELVIVDDCSTDGTYNTAESYQKQDNRIRLYKTDGNTGSAYLPIRLGIHRAHADWIVILAGDDMIEESYLEKLNIRQRETDADIVMARMCGFSTQYSVTHMYPSEDFQMECVITGEEACMLTIPEWQIGANGALVRKNLYFKVWDAEAECYNGMNADELQTRQLLLSARNVAFVEAKFLYREHEASISRRISLKLFDSLETNIRIRKLIRGHFGEDSTESAAAEEMVWGGVLHFTSLYINNHVKLARQDARMAFRKLKCAWKDVDWVRLKSRPHWRLFGARGFYWFMAYSTLRHYGRKIKLSLHI